MCLLDVALGEPFGKHVCHRLRGVGNWKWELGIVARHGGYVLSIPSDSNRHRDGGGAYEVFWYVYVERFGHLAKYGADLAHAVRAIIEQEQGITIFPTTMSK